MFFLTGGGDTPATLCAKLTAAGLGDIQSAEGVQYREVLFNSPNTVLISGEIRLTHSTTGIVYTLYLKDYTYAP